MKKILIIEDEDAIRETLAEYLTLNGYDVSTAANGKEGLFQAITQKPHLVLSDIMMPEMNGYEVLELLQQNHEMAGTPFIFLTAKSEHHSLRAGMNLGADDYLTKPVRLKELRDVIEKRLQKADAFRNNLETEYNKIIADLNLSVQHEFNTPLNGILGFSQLLMDNTNISPEKLGNFARTINDSAIRLRDTLQNIMLYRSLLTGTLHASNDLFTVNTDLIRELAESVAARHKRDRCLRITNFPEFDLYGSEQHFTKIVTEIIDNAFKFSKESCDIQIKYSTPEGKNTLEVYDTGYGFPPGDTERIDAFVQFDRIKHAQQGLGLGLFLSKKLAALYNWNIAIQANTPRGTVVSLVTDFNN